MQRSKTGFAISVALVLSAAHAQGQDLPRSDQQRKGPTLVDHGYGFAYTAPPGWEVLDEAGSREVLPAHALAVGPHSHFVAVRVSQAASPGAWIRDALEGFDLPPPERDLAQLELDGRQTVWTTRPCVFGGVPVRLVLSAVRHRGWVIGLTHWRPASDPPGAKEVRDLWSPVSLTPGDAAPGRQAPALPDQSGVGWRTRGGIFESAAFGLLFSPAPELTLLVGDDLAQVHDEATVGWSDDRINLRGALIAERAPPEGAAEYAAALAKTFSADVRSKPERVLQVSIDSARGALAIYRFAGQGEATYLAYGVLAHESLVIQVQAEWPISQHEAALEALPRQLACARLLPSEARAKLAGELLAAGDPEHVLGPDFVLRGGEFRDYTHRLSWKKPVGFWQVACGPDPEARMDFTAPQLGLGGMCAVEELPQELTAKQVHRAVRDAVLADAGAQPDGDPTAVSGRGVEFLVTRFTVQAAFELRCVLATAVVGRRALSVRIWGLPQLVAGNERAVTACLQAFRVLPDSTRAVTLSAGRIENARLGYRVVLPGETWERTIKPSPDWHWHHAAFTRGAARVEVSGVAQPGFRRSASAQSAARVSVLADLAEEHGDAFGHPTPLSHDTLRGVRVVGQNGKVEVAILRKGDCMLTVVLSGPAEERPPLAEVLKGVSFLE